MGNKGSKGKGIHASDALLVAADTMVNVPLIASLSDEQKALMKKNLERKQFKNRQFIIREGDKPDGFYIIEHGEAEVQRKREDGKTQSIATLGGGDYFGERALVTQQPRAASVVALGRVDCLYLSAEKFSSLFNKEELNMAFPKREAVCAEGTNDLVTLQHKPRIEELKKTGAQKRRIDQALNENELFSQYDSDQINRIGQQMYLQAIKKGDAPVKQGEFGDHVYVVEAGKFEVTVVSEKDKDQKKTVVCTLGPENVFGELALMYNSRRNATVTALEDSKVWVMDRFTFRRIILNTSAEKLKEFKDFLKKVPLLKGLSRVEREKVAEALDEISYKAGQTVVTEGEVGDCMFLVRRGECTAKRGGEADSITYRAGDYFGELALKDEAAKNRRQATVTAKTECVLLKLSRVAVNLLLGPVEDLIKKGIKKYSEINSRNASREGSVSVSTTTIGDSIEGKTVITENKPAFEDLQIIGRLGNGAFGLVRLVEDSKNPGHAFALKAVSKLKVVRSKQESHLVNERRILLRVKHPFVTRLYATYQDSRSVYFLLEPCLGGELFTILRSNTSFSERTSKYYAATVVEIFDHLQKRNIVYRDLKPENLLLDARGFLKMTDFGFAKVIQGKTYTLCGTPDYLAPEIVVGKGHGKAVDWWTLGVLVYEMVAGYPPFYASKPMKTYQKIIHARVKYPNHFSDGVIQLISQLLTRKPSERLGVTHGGPGLVRQQKWFKGFDWAGLMSEKLPPPIKPTVKSATDIGNFRNNKKKDPEPPAYFGSDEWCKEF